MEEVKTVQEKFGELIRSEYQRMKADNEVTDFEKLDKIIVGVLSGDVFEAIHGTAPFLINHGCGDYADPCSLIRAVGMMMAHIDYGDRKAILPEEQI